MYREFKERRSEEKFGTYPNTPVTPEVCKLQCSQ